MGSSVVICIPAFNEEKKIASVIDDVNHHGDVFVFDNNSTDKTVALSVKSGAKIVSVKNQGYDSVIESISYFFLHSNYTKLIIIDGDGEVGVNKIQESIQLLDKFDAVMGARSSIKRISEKIVCLLFSILFGVKDIYCGFKCFKKNGINPKYVSNTFGTSIFKKGASVFNQPVTIEYRDGDSRLGKGLSLSYRLLVGGIKGLIR